MTTQLRRIMLYGEEEGDHLRIDIQGDELVLVSHELIIGRIQSHYRDRTLMTLTRDQWLMVSRLIGGEPDGN